MKNALEDFVEALQSRNLNFGIRVVEQLRNGISQLNHFELLGELVQICAYEIEELLTTLVPQAPLIHLSLQNYFFSSVQEKLIVWTILTKLWLRLVRNF